MRTVAQDVYDSKHAAGVCLGTIQARTHVQLALACQQSMISVHPTQATAHPCNTCLVTVEIWVMNVLTMPLHLGHSDLPLATMLLPTGFIITFLCGCNNITEVSERLQRMRTDVASISQNRSYCCVHHRVHWVSCASHVLFVIFLITPLVFLLSAFLRMCTFSSE